MSTQAGQSTGVLNQKPSAKEQGRQSLSVKNQIVCSLGFVGHIVVTTQLGILGESSHREYLNK